MPVACFQTAVGDAAHMGFPLEAGNLHPFFCIIVVLLSLEQVGVCAFPGRFHISQRSLLPTHHLSGKVKYCLFSFNCFL